MIKITYDDVQIIVKEWEQKMIRTTCATRDAGVNANEDRQEELMDKPSNEGGLVERREIDSKSSWGD